jgi:protein TonB
VPASATVSVPAVASSGAGKASGVEVAGTGPGTASGGSVLASYLTLVDWKIQQNWVPMGAAVGPETVVVVRFRVFRSGQVRDVELESTSGNASLDASALRAIRQSLPLPPFPNLLTDPSLDLRYRFVVERG